MCGSLNEFGGYHIFCYGFLLQNFYFQFPIPQIKAPKWLQTVLQIGTRSSFFGFKNKRTAKYKHISEMSDMNHHDFNLGYLY